MTVPEQFSPTPTNDDVAAFLETLTAEQLPPNPFAPGVTYDPDGDLIEAIWADGDFYGE